jgi:GxxExxY protein
MPQISYAPTQDRDPETYAIIGAAMMVHRTLGRGFLELVYQEALALEFGLRDVPYVREIEIPIFYRDVPLAARYRADFVCFGKVLVELKAASRLTGVDDSQIINYLVATRLGRGLLLNFGSSSLQYRRFAGPTLSPTSSSVQSAQSVDSTGPES